MEIPKTEILVTLAGREHANYLFEPGEYFIGSGDDCQLRFTGEQIAGRHAKLTINFDGILIEDLGSSSGTHVNGKRVTEPTRLWPNQKIQLGTAMISLRRQRTGDSTNMSVAPQTAAIRRVLPEEFLRDKKYEIGGVVAQGGMGAILDAKEATTARTVAMKVMLDNTSAETLMRFVTEAKITAQLEHPCIVPVYELSVDENEQVFYTMKFVRGVTLRNIVEGLAAGDKRALAKYPLAQLLTIFQKVCDAIAFAHSKGIIHRDLKPENVMIGDYGEVLVMDWGLAKVLDAERATQMLLPPQPAAMQGSPDDSVSPLTTMIGQILGTPQFMPPEQAEGRNDELDPRADIYSLGAILCQMLTLRPPIEGKDVDEVLNKVCAGDVAWPATFTAGAKRLPHLPNGKVPDSLNAVVMKAMSRMAEDRYPTVSALQADIVAYQNGFATSVEHATAWTQMKLLVKRNRGASIATAAGILLLAIAYAVFTARVIRERNRAIAGELDATKQRDAAEHERLKAEINAEAAQLVNLAQTDAEDALIRSVVNVEKCKRTLGEVTAPVSYGLTAALERYRLLGTLPHGRPKVCAWASSARLLASFEKRVWLSNLDKNIIKSDTWRFQGDPIEHLAVTSDAKWVALAGNDTAIRLWNSADDRLTRTWTAHAEWIRAVAFSDDEKLLFSVSSDGLLKTWNLEGTEAAPEQKLEMDGQKIGIAAIGDSGCTVVAVADSPLTTQAHIFVRDTPAAPYRRITVSGHASRISAAAVSTDGERVATADGDGTIRVWSRDGKLIGGPSQIHRSLVEAITFDPDGDCIASREGTGSAVVSTTEGIVVHGLFNASGGRNLACTGDGRLIVDNQVLDLLGLESAPALNIGTTILHMARSLDGSLLGAIDDTGTVRVWKLPGRELITEAMIAPGRGKFLSISPDNKLIAACLLAEDTVHFIRPDGKPARAPLELKDGKPVALSFHATTGRLIIATTTGTLLSFDPSGNAGPVRLDGPLTTIPDEYMGSAIDATRENILVRFSGKDTPATAAIFTGDGRNVARINAATGARGIAMSFPSNMDVSPEGDLACFVSSGLIQNYSLPDLKTVGSFPVNSAWPTGIFSISALKSGRLAIGNGEGGVRILNTSGEPLSPWLVRDRKPIAVQMSDPSRENVLASGREARIRFWETSEQKWMAQAAQKLSRTQRIRGPATPLDIEAARIVAANLTDSPRPDFRSSHKTSRRGSATAASLPTPPADAPGLTRLPGVPFALKLPDGWVVADPLKVAFIDKLMRTIVFKERGREVSILGGFLPKDASILQVNGGGDMPLIGITRLNGGSSPAELGVFARKAKEMAERAMQVLGTLKIDAQTSRNGFTTEWIDAAGTAAIDFEGKTNTGGLLLGRGYYVPTRQGTYVIAAKFTGDTARASMAELDRSVAAIQLPEALRVDAAFLAGFRKEIGTITAEQSIELLGKERDRLRENARSLRNENKLPEAGALMEKAAAICAELISKRPADSGKWTLEYSRTIEEEAGFFAAKDRHAEALPIAERALEKAADAMQRLSSTDARFNLAKCHLRKAVSAAALKKFPEAVASFETAIILLREDAEKGGDPARLRLAVDTAMKLADVRASMQDTEGISKALDGATADMGALASLRVKDSFEMLPGLLDKMSDRLGPAAGGRMTGEWIPKLIAASEGEDAAALKPEVLLSALKAFVRVAEKAKATPGTTTVPIADLCKHAESLGERLKAKGALTPDAEFWLGGARVIPLPPRTFPIPRSPEATNRQLDLSAHYNSDLDQAKFGGDKRYVLRALPDGLQTLDGVVFDIRGLMQVSSPSFPKDVKLPDSIPGIPVKQQVRRLHMLHGCRWTAHHPDARIGTYILNFQDGQKAELPILYGKDVRDWSAQMEKDQVVPNASVAWSGYGGPEGIRLYHRAYDNPRPDVEVLSIDFVSAKANSTPLLIAITVE